MSCTIQYSYFLPFFLFLFFLAFGEIFFGSLLSDASGGGICGCPIERNPSQAKKNKETRLYCTSAGTQASSETCKRYYAGLSLAWNK
ncbi:hypothetical protein HOY82DRAFT_554765 [Tuber indicum]|nr:hypothetical protein HOY82DRAFT_554765 [Tuber indicum]